MALLRRIRKKVLKRLAMNAFFPAMRITALRWCGFAIGRETYIADGFIVVEELADTGNLTIGSRVSMGPRVTVVTSSHPNASRIAGVAPVAKGPVVIEDDVWIGAHAVILPGVRLGRGCVIAAGAVVTKDVEPLTVVGGQPARAIRTLPEPAGW